MPPHTKPYRRFKARGAGKSSEGLDGLKSLTEGAAAAERPDPVPLSDPPKPPRKWWSFRGMGVWGWTWRVGVVVVLGLVAWGVFGFLAIHGAVDQANNRITASARQALTPGAAMLSSPQNTLIIGSDARPGETRSRADTIMIMRTDPGAGKVKWLSIPRDFRVALPGQGADKINAAYYFAGQRGIITAVRDLTGLPIHHLVTINFNGVKKMVDDIGGITVTNPTALSNCKYPGGTTVSFPAGQIDLNGDEALKFVRVRKCDDDFHRAARQQAFVTGVKGKMASLTTIPFSPWNGAAAIRAIGTDMGTTDLMKLGWLQWRLTSNPADRVVLAGIPRYVNGISYVVGEPNMDEQQIADFVRR